MIMAVRLHPISTGRAFSITSVMSYIINLRLRLQ